MSTTDSLGQRLFGGRPWWMNVLMVFCAYMTFIYMPFDMFLKPVAGDEEVWFGVVLTGWAAKATEPLHWAIYALGLRGFWGMRPWMHPWAALYVVQLAIAMLVWGLTDPRSPNVLFALVPFVLFLALAAALWRAAPQFRGAHAE